MNTSNTTEWKQHSVWARKCKEWGKLQRATWNSITSPFFVWSRGKAVGSEKELWRP